MPLHRKPDVCFTSKNLKSFSFNNNKATLKFTEVYDKCYFIPTDKGFAGKVLTIDTDKDSDKVITYYLLLKDKDELSSFIISPAENVSIIWLNDADEIEDGKNYIVQFRQINQSTVLASLTNSTLVFSKEKPVPPSKKKYAILLELETTQPDEIVYYTLEQLHVDLSNVSLYWDYDPLTDTLGEETHSNSKMYHEPGIHHLVLISDSDLKWPSLYNIDKPRALGANLIGIKRYKEGFITTLIKTDANGNPIGDFGSCVKLEYIEEGLQLIDENLESAKYLFYYCTALEELPHSLFKTCINIKSFEMTFRNCTNLKNIPEDLFHDNVNAEDFTYCFAICKKLESIPNNLFNKCSKVTTFANCFGWCENLSSIPGDLFDNCQDATNFGGCFCFFSGTTLVPKIESIPYNLFSKNKKIQYIDACFSHQKNITITEDTPKLWDNTKWPEITNSNRCFFGCKDPNNIVPSSWK